MEVISLDWRLDIMALTGEALKQKIKTLNRRMITEWLQWNDPNGIYADKQSRRELGRIMSRKEGVEIMIRHIEDPDYRRLVAFSKIVARDISNGINV